jgi:hypothetical protein
LRPRNAQRIGFCSRLALALPESDIQNAINQGQQRNRRGGKCRPWRVT